jgi:uncharacterized protein (TIGR00255 family)
MICSMTGFGRASFEVAGVSFAVEIRSVNHRHLDTKVRVPRQLSEHESSVSARVQERLERGRVDVSISLAGGGTTSGQLVVDEEVAGSYVRAARELARVHDLAGDLAVGTVLTLPGVTSFAERSFEGDTLAAALQGAVDSALDEVVQMRAAEGAALEKEFRSRLAHVGELTDSFQARAGLVVQAARERLRKRAEQLRAETGLLDEARLHQEVVIAADRLDITEELVRLRSHVEQFRQILASAGAGSPVGRRLDFLLQEMGREANTVGSKANDAPLAHDVVELKTELERIREQVQNVE